VLELLLAEEPRVQQSSDQGHELHAVGRFDLASFLREAEADDLVPEARVTAEQFKP